MRVVMLRLLATALLTVFVAGCGSSLCVRDRTNRGEIFALTWYPGFGTYSNHVQVRVYEDGALIEKRNG